MSKVKIKHCPKCKQERTWLDLFCWYCGEELKIREDEKECECGYQDWSGPDRYCPKCGRKRELPSVQ